MPADDLFGAPAEEGAAAPAADDLFGAPADETPAAAADDLFGEPAADAPAAEPAADDLFGDPASAAEPATDDSLDDLFGTPQPAEEAAPAAADDLFSQTQPASRPRELSMRHWNDNTGLFSVEGRLVEVLDGKVRLMKVNGRTCTVEMRRLSAIDAEYVQQIVATYGRDLMGAQLAAR